MRIQSLSISNFRAVTRLDLRDLQDTVIIAGPNGCGKSCVFDAIRLLKSVYGGYSPNEWHSWFGEFKIDINKPKASWHALLQNRAQPAEIAANIQLSEAEVEFLSASARELLSEQVWKEVVPQLSGLRSAGDAAIAAHSRHQPEVDRRVDEALPELLEQAKKPTHHAQITIQPNAIVRNLPSRLLELVFSHYDPQNIGVVDYHGANRNYNREQIGGINLNIQSSEERQKQHSLYNFAAKYANLKSEMAASYIRQLLSKESGTQSEDDRSLGETVRELFTTFFPGKEFLGPRPTPDGSLLFPVRTPNGAEHDIDELSSGEKEVLYGYLRLRNAAPKHSVLMIDEPELHLNPRLIMGLASFYHRHLGRALHNQLWLVTHSDTLIREAVGQQGFSIFHMQPPGQYEGPNQATSVQAGQDLERLVIGLVGDLAAYRPGAKIVIFEGGGDSEFDVRMTCTLFPRFGSATNPISGGNKRRVSDLYDLLEKASKQGYVPGRFYAITDSDNEPPDAGTIPARYKWDAYHIENYLLEPDYILRVLKELNLDVGSVCTSEGVLEALRESAKQTTSSLIAHQLRTYANASLIGAIDLGFDPAKTSVSQEIWNAVERSAQRLGAIVTNNLTPQRFEEMEKAFQSELNTYFESDLWRLKCRGRDVLKRFAGAHARGIPYESFRDLIIARMRDAEYQPAGMKDVVERILSDEWNRRQPNPLRLT